MRIGTWVTFYPISLLEKDNHNNPAPATPHSAESQKLQKLTQQNAKHNRPLTRKWGQKPRNPPGGSPLLPHHEKVTNQLAEGEGGGTGSCRVRFRVTRREGPRIFVLYFVITEAWYE